MSAIKHDVPTEEQARVVEALDELSTAHLPGRLEWRVRQLQNILIGIKHTPEEDEP